MLRVRDAIDRDYALELDVDAMAGIAAVSPAHLIRTFHLVFGETPHQSYGRDFGLRDPFGNNLRIGRIPSPGA